MALTVEQVLDKLADKLISDEKINTSVVQQNQKTIRGGLIELGRTNQEKLILFQTDEQANKEDFPNPESFQSLVSQLSTDDIGQVDFLISFSDDDPPVLQEIIMHDLASDETYPVTEIFYNSDTGNPVNLSQFMSLQKLTQDIEIGLAEEYLDTTIFELLPSITFRQQRIINFFNEWNNLKGAVPDFELDGEGFVGEDFSAEDYYESHDISAAQETPDVGIQEEDAFITRLQSWANDGNTQYTLEGLRNELNSYLVDIDEELPPPGDERPEYRNESSGYLKFRDLNQGIIVRNTDNKFIQGLNPDNPTWQQDGFTITMWVRFLDKSSQGTLFNFGNPLNPDGYGFALETYVIQKDDNPTKTGFGSVPQNTWGQIFMDGNQLGLSYDNSPPSEGFFSQDTAERFVRLVVRDGSKLRGSHIGMPFLDRRDGLPEFGYWDNENEFDHEFGLMTNTRIPINYSEWYFICATFNPNILEEESFSYGAFKNDSDFWNGNKFTDGVYTHYSGYGAKCKVEIISKTDLLRARGFKVN